MTGSKRMAPILRWEPMGIGLTVGIARPLHGKVTGFVPLNSERWGAPERLGDRRHRGNL